MNPASLLMRAALCGGLLALLLCVPRHAPAADAASAASPFPAPTPGADGGTADAGEPEKPRKAKAFSTLVIYFENDLFGGTDQYYTNAVQARFVSPDLKTLSDDEMLPDLLDGLIERLPFAGDPDAQYNVSVAFGQAIYTPSDTQVREYIPGDRPYAGFLYGAIGLHAKKGDRMDTLQFTGGIVGPSARGETAQNEVHELRHIPTAKGWDNQLHDEPGLMLSWQRNWRLNPASTGRGFGWDVLPRAGATVGNVLTQANVGAEMRFGWNLPGDFETSLIRPGGGIEAPTDDADPRVRESWGWYLFAGADGRAVGHDIFLDGNTFRDSHDVDKKHFVADLSGGLAVIIEGVRITYTHVYRTEEFVGQDRGQHFGSLTVGVSF
ncbi:lipid A deacylase LpxR family protein [Nitratidesulfovibrio sp. D1]|uniref:lipid A deacylase LpxR family protein n=1 Tax=Nitratidesulfovibrio sp. D1 TaxID=3440151 RepID=UPI003EB9366A